MKGLPMDTMTDERGAVLLTVLIMLVLLSVLGVMSVSTSTTEIDISGNYRREQAAFYNADAGIGYAMTAAVIYTGASLHTTPYTATVTIDDGNSYTTDYPSQVRVEYLSTGGIPRGSFGTEQGESLSADYYSATTTGAGPGNTQTVLEAQYAMLVYTGNN